MLIGLGAAFACLALAAFGLLAAVDSGRFNTSLAQFASKRLKRTVAFDTVRTHLLSGRPSLTVGGLRIGAAAWAGSANLLEADRIRLSFRWPALTVTDIEIDRPRVNLLRATRERDNWSSGKSGGGSGFLDRLETLKVTNGSFVFDDRVRDLRLTGTLVHDVAVNATRPLAVSARGLLKGGEIQLSALGGALNHRPRNASYPFSARLQDGATFLEVSGVSDKPAQFKGFDLAVTARGPNLADMKYLIDVGLPNSAPYRLSARLSRQGRVTRATGLKAVVGRSDFAGSIVSDGARKRRLLTVELDSQTLYAADVGAFLAHIPAHEVTRSVSGVAPQGGGQGRLLTTKPIDLKRFRLKDARLDIKARRFVVDGVSPGRLNTVGTLDHGKFELRPFTIDFPSGRADGVLGLDLNGARPAFRLDGTVRKAALSSLLPGIAKTVSGTVELQVHVAGAGASFRDVALNAEGRIGVRLRDGAIQKSKADVISGAVVQGAFTALANKNARTALPCAVADLGVRGGKVSTRRVLLVTDVGTAVADGAVNLAGETLDLTIYGRPSRFRLFAVNAPVTIGGPMLHPQVQVRLGGGDKRDPAHPAPQAPKVGEGDRAAFCSQQLAGGL